MTTRKLAPIETASSLRASAVKTTPRVRIVFGDTVCGKPEGYASVGRAVGAALSGIPTGARVLDAKGRVRARLSHFVTERGTTLAGWFLVSVEGGL